MNTQIVPDAATCPACLAEMNTPCLLYTSDQLKEDIGEVIFRGIQPDIVGFYYPMTQPIKDAVETVYQRLEEMCIRDSSGTGDLLRNWRCCCAVATADALCCCTSAAGAC